MMQVGSKGTNEVTVDHRAGQKVINIYFKFSDVNYRVEARIYAHIPGVYS